MLSTVNIVIHASQFPEKVRMDLLESLRSRRVNHKFHYDSVKQTQKWLAVHQKYSPSRNDENCAATYDQSFESAAGSIRNKRIHVIGLGCGGGQKDTRLLKHLRENNCDVFYSPCDVSTAMVLVANQTASELVPSGHSFPFVCDLVSANDLPSVLEKRDPPNTQRLITFFGMIPNFEPQFILPKLTSLIRPEDILLFSANLLPEADQDAGWRRILPQYDNPLTRDWLTAFLFDLGTEPGDGELRIHMESDPFAPDLKRIVADYRFVQARTIQVDSERFEFRPGESIRLFFSYRYTAPQIRSLLNQHDLKVQQGWVTTSQEEGVFLCSRK